MFLGAGTAGASGEHATSEGDDFEPQNVQMLSSERHAKNEK
jgi:hypothetical protein